MKVELEQSEFAFLLREVRRRYEASLKESNQKIPDKETAYYGWKEFRGNKNTLGYCVENHPDVATFLCEYFGEKPVPKNIVNGKNLYDRFSNAAYGDVKWPMVFQGIYEKVYFLYIGCEDVTAFRKLHKEQVDEYALKFTAYYYSFLKFEVKAFDVEFEFENESKVKARLRGFHDNEPEIWMKGTGEKDPSSIFITLQEPKLGFASLAIHSREKDLAKPDNFLLGMLLAQNSITRYPVTTPVLLIHRDHEHPNESELKIRRYLMLKRDHIRIKDYEEYQQGLDALKVRKVSANKIAHMAGWTFRIWSYTRRGHIIQTKFRIEEDYRAYLYVTIYGGIEHEQTCLLSINTEINERLIVSAHPKLGTGYLSFAILEIPNQNDEIFRGAYSTVGVRGKHSTANQIVLVKDESNFEAKSIETQKELDEIIARNSHLEELRKKLVSVYYLDSGKDTIGQDTRGKNQNV